MRWAIASGFKAFKPVKTLESSGIRTGALHRRLIPLTARCYAPGLYELYGNIERDLASDDVVGAFDPCSPHWVPLLREAARLSSELARSESAPPLVREKARSQAAEAARLLSGLA